MEKELNYLGKALTNPTRPFVAILGGAKVSDKIEVVENLMKVADAMLIGGGMAYTFFKAQGLPIGKSLVEDDKLDLARKLLADAKQKNLKLLLPSTTSSRLNSKRPPLQPPSTSPTRPLTKWASTSVPKRSPRLQRKLPKPRLSFGTAPWAFSKCPLSPMARSKSPEPSPPLQVPAPLRSSAAAIPLPPFINPALPTGFLTSPPAAALLSNFWLAPSSPASKP